MNDLNMTGHEMMEIAMEEAMNGRMQQNEMTRKEMKGNEIK